MSPKTIGIITYDFPHLKTEQVAHAFIRMGYKLKFFAFPFQPRKAREVIFSHRPDQSASCHPRNTAEKHGFEYRLCTDDAEIDSTCDFYHVLVGKIISPEGLVGKKIINCHPGIIPAVRGLDAWKWTVLDKKPLGVTLHYIDAEVDKGEVISIVPTPVYPSDTPDRLARRHYETELAVVCNFERYLSSPVNEFQNIAEGEQHMRMGRKTETEMLRSFDEYLKQYS